MKKARYRSLVAVYVMAINTRQEILLLRRINTGYRDGFYDMPAGHLEEGEMLRQAALREFEEETGLVASEEHLEFVKLLHRVSTDRVYLDVFFQLKEWKGEASIMEPSKCDHMEWFPLKELPKNIVPHQHQVIHDMTQSCPYEEIQENL
jgi:8-oxo-dGTP diphosphatase